jgi:putative DNA primase/helicase
MIAPDLAARLRLHRSGRSLRGTCPACGYADALCITEKGGRNLAWCASCQDQTAVFAALRGVGEGWTPPERRDDATEREAEQKRQDAALRLWRGSEAATNTPADAYLSSRALAGLAASAALRYRGDCGHPDDRARHPAMIALVVDCAEKPIAVHRTFLTRDGRKASVVPVKASKGPVWGGAIRLDPVAPELVIGEGIETSASAGRLLNLPAWAALSAGSLATDLILPMAVRAVVIAADPDAPGEQAANAAAKRWQAEGRHVRIARPTGAGDFKRL